MGSVGYCGHTGRLVQLCISRSVPMEPSRIQPITCSIDPLESHGMKCVATPVVARGIDHPLGLLSRLAIGLCTITCLPRFMAAMR